MKILILALIFQAGDYKIMGSNQKFLNTAIERVKNGTFRLKTTADIGACDIQPMDGHLLPIFRFVQHEDRKTFTTVIKMLGKIDTNVYLQCEVLDGSENTVSI